MMHFSRTRIFISSGCGGCARQRAMMWKTTRNTSSFPMMQRLGSSSEKSASAARRRYYRQQQQQRCSSTVSTNSSASSSATHAIPASGTAATTTSSSHDHDAPLLSALRQFLLRPRSVPLPRYLTPRHYTYTLSETFGHASFVLVAVSYSTSDFLLLRLLAVLGSASMVAFAYFHPHGRVLWLPLKWNLLFIGINLYRIGRVYYYRYCATHRVPEPMKRFREKYLGAVDPVDYYRLLGLAVEETFEEGAMVIQQGQVNPHVRIVLEGELQVLRDGTLTYVLEEGMFVSEGGLHAGLMLRGGIESCCSIVVGPKFDGGGGGSGGDAADEERRRGQHPCGGHDNIRGRQGNDESKPHVNDGTRPATKQVNRVRCLRWNRTELVDLLLESSNNNNNTTSGVDNGGGGGGGGLLGNALRAALSWDIVRKLKSQRHMLTEGRVKDPTSWSRKREEQGIARYASILQNLLRQYSSEKKEDFLRMSQVLAKYRGIHRIDDDSHEKALAKCGWTVEEFRSGRRSPRMKKTINGIVLHEHDGDEDDDDEDLDDRRRGDGLSDDENFTTNWGKRALVRLFQ